MPKTISAGIRVKTEIVAMIPQAVPVVVTYSDSPVVSVRALKLVNVAASKYSFHAKTHVRINVTATPGRARGKMMS